MTKNSDGEVVFNSKREHRTKDGSEVDVWKPKNSEKIGVTRTAVSDSARGNKSYVARYDADRVGSGPTPRGSTGPRTTSASPEIERKGAQSEFKTASSQDSVLGEHRGGGNGQVQPRRDQVQLRQRQEGV